MSEPEEHPFGETEYKNYDPEQVNTPEDVAALFRWVAEENRKKENTTAAEVFDECAFLVEEVLGDE
jgi:hypothetical protein